MRQASKRIPDGAEKTVRDIRRNTRRHHSAEERRSASVRKRLKLKLSSKKVDGNRVYRIAGAGSGKMGARPTPSP